MYTRVSMRSAYPLMAAAWAVASLGCDGGFEPPPGVVLKQDTATIPIATDLALSPFNASVDAGLPPEPDSAVPAPDIAPPSPCDIGETYHEGACYSAPGVKWISFDVGRQICAGRNAEVASITSPEVNQLVFGLLHPLNQQAWIGLRHTGGSHWVDGTPVGFVNWAPGEPNNEGGVEDCTVMWGPNLKSHPDWQGKWNDTACDTQVDTVICRRVP